MDKIDRRKHPRIQIYDPISYLSLDHHGNIKNQNIGVALDISQNGIRIVTTHSITSPYLLLLFVDLKNKLSEIEGYAVYCRKKGPYKFETGIELIGSPQERINFVKKLIVSYHYILEQNRLINSEKLYN